MSTRTQLQINVVRNSTKKSAQARIRNAPQLPICSWEKINCALSPKLKTIVPTL